ncbi:MAG TPA: methionine adenosyltransferase [Clostridiales bacterium]|nr:methionine adenosyltransferase [Candidatus Apopatosoma intestinale]CCZ20056.1 s-adenosylmethionine synthase [Candidatus Apopatosoma intestinale]HBO65073.1 methionine adenosyltransferase [Candidatus Apopatosoma intestinale]
MERKFFATESVTPGHPDKVCDRISDSVLDAIYAVDPMARVACETCATTDLVMVMGEITTTADIDIEKIVREAVREIGYIYPDCGFCADTCTVINKIHKQSPDIALGVDNSLEAKEGDDSAYEKIGAGDQGMMFGFACDETPCYMPFGYVLANELSRKLTEVRKNGTLPYLRPDGKTQVTVEYDGDKVVRLANIVVSSQHSADVSLEQIRRDIIKYVIEPVVPAKYIDDKTEIFVNPTGRFVIGGPDGDSGLTGRKIIVDTYGGYGRHGGGAFSGKDPTKVDRSACYAARYIAKNIVAAGIAKKCEVQIAYAIGVAKPLCVNINTFGTGICADDRIAAAVSEVVDLRPAAIIDYFGLRAPIYRELSAFGHFGREELGVRWEKIDIADKLLEKIK